MEEQVFNSDPQQAVEPESESGGLVIDPAGRVVREPVPVTASGPSERGFAELTGSRVLEYYTSLDRTNPAGRLRFLQASQAADRAVSDTIGQWLPCEHIIMQLCELANAETGELELATRIVILGHDGRSVDCWSNGVARGLQMVYQEFGRPPYPPGFELLVEQKRAGKKGRTYVLSCRQRTEEPTP